MPITPNALRQTLSAFLGYLMITPPVLIMVLLIFLPAAQAMVRTLWITPEGGAPAFSLTNYTTFFADPISRANVWFTVWVTLATVTALFVVCFPLALYFRFSNTWLANVVQVLALFPLFVPGIILAFALIRYLGPHGTVDTILNLLFGYTGYKTPYLKASGIIIGLVWDHIPFTVLVLTAGLRQVDAALIESARDVGANGWQIFTRILLPLIQRSALIVFCLNVIGIFGAFTIPYLLGPAQPQMMGVYMFQTYSQYLDRAGAETQAVLTFLFCAVVGVLYVRTIAKQQVGR